MQLHFLMVSETAAARLCCSSVKLRSAMCGIPLTTLLPPPLRDLLGNNHDRSDDQEHRQEHRSDTDGCTTRDQQRPRPEAADPSSGNEQCRQQSDSAVPEYAAGDLECPLSATVRVLFWLGHHFAHTFPHSHLNSHPFEVSPHAVVMVRLTRIECPSLSRCQILMAARPLPAPTGRTWRPADASRSCALVAHRPLTHQFVPRRS